MDTSGSAIDASGKGADTRRLSFEDEQDERTENVAEEKQVTKIVTIAFTETGGPKQLGLDLVLKDGVVHIADVKAYRWGCVLGGGALPPGHTVAPPPAARPR